MTREDIGILVVDDVNAMRMQVRDLLKGYGFKNIHLAGSGEEAMQCLGSQSVHLVLADWHMQPMTGLDLLKQLRAHPAYKDIAYVMVTAENTKESVLEAIKAGVDDYLVKPLTAAQIQNKVYTVLFKKQVFK